MLATSSKTALKHAYLKEYAIGADELLGNPDSHFMQMEPVIKNHKRKQQENVTFQRHWSCSGKPMLFWYFLLNL
jgi:hypothetical protein